MKTHGRLEFIDTVSTQNNLVRNKFVDYIYTYNYTERCYIVGMLKFLIDIFVDNIFVEYGGFVFQQTIGIPLGTLL